MLICVSFTYLSESNFRIKRNNFFLHGKTRNLAEVFLHRVEKYFLEKN